MRSESVLPRFRHGSGNHGCSRIRLYLGVTRTGLQSGGFGTGHHQREVQRNLRNAHHVRRSRQQNSGIGSEVASHRCSSYGRSTLRSKALPGHPGCSRREAGQNDLRFDGNHRRLLPNAAY
uniref:(northern house mosquito) hypothetical protein n=1 Tax=Culex pipiens TaxID=7175 RepID=A0A8D8HGL1_CULPI